MRTYKVERYKNEYKITEIKTRKKFLLFGDKITIKNIFVGSSTVWHSFPDGARCGVLKETELCDILKREKFRESI